MAIRSRLALAAGAAMVALFVVSAPASAGPVPAFDKAFASTSAAGAHIEQVQFRRGGGVFRRGNGGRTALGIGLAAGVLGALAVGAVARPAPPRPVYEEPMYGHPREPVYMRPAPRPVVVEQEPLYGHPRDPVYMRPARPAYSDAASICAQRYRSYDPASGTYRAFDGSIRSCP